MNKKIIPLLLMFILALPLAFAYSEDPTDYNPFADFGQIMGNGSFSNVPSDGDGLATARYDYTTNDCQYDDDSFKLGTMSIFCPAVGGGLWLNEFDLGSAYNDVTYQIAFYDDGDTTGEVIFKIKDTSPGDIYQFGFDSAVSGTNYMVDSGDSSIPVKQNDWTNFTIEMSSEGWAVLWINGVEAANETGGITGNFRYIYWHVQNGKNIYLDDIMIWDGSVTNRPIGLDTTPPTFSTPAVNNSAPITNSVINLSNLAEDETSLSTIIGSHNLSGIWTNVSNTTVEDPTTSYNYSITVTANKPVGTVIGFRFCANDTTNNWACSGVNTVTIQQLPAPIVTITNPSNDDTLDNNSYPLWINGTATVSGSVVNQTWINNTNWKLDSGTNTNFGFSMNGTITEFEYNFIMIFANNSEGLVSNSTVYFDTDFTNPLVKSTLDSNNTFYYSLTNFTFQFNFTDSRQIYSFNISTPQGYLYNITGLNTTKYIFNGSINGSSYGVGKQNITTEVCDAHTKNKIKDYETTINDLEREIMFNFDDDYLIIRPLDTTTLAGASTKKLEDRYSFTFKKNKNNKKNDITFMVLSSQKIDILGNTDKYSGWLVIPALSKWIDFNTKDRKNIKYEINRIDDYLVLIKVKGIKDDIFTFNSVGDLNCIKETYNYYLYNHTVIYDTPAIANTPTNLKLIINLEDLKVNTTGFLNYNSTLYSVDNVSSATQINYTINITPQQYTNVSNYLFFYWDYTLNNQRYNTSIYTQEINSIFLTRWGNLSNVSVINFTIYNEVSNTVISGNIDGTFNYLEGTVDFDVEGETNFSLAIYPAGATTSGNYTIYYSAAGHPERRYYEPLAVYSNNTQIVKLYLLNTSLGGYATFRIQDIYQNPLTEVTGKMEKVIDGSLVTVEQQSSDGSGLMTFFVNPDDDYTFTFSKTGYTSYSATIRPITTEIYTITLEQEGAEVIPPYSAEVKYFFTPTNTVLNNGTKYNFTFNLTSEYWDIEDCTLYIKNTTNTLNSSSDSFTNNNCLITIEYDVGKQTTIISEAKYTLNSIVNTVSIQYTVQYTYKGEFSLMNFIDDIKAFSSAGFDDFTRSIIVFIVIFGIVAYASSQMAGLREPETLIILAWALVMVFSYLGLLTLSYASIPDIAPLGREWLQQYIISILFSLGAGSYIIRRHL